MDARTDHNTALGIYSLLGLGFLLFLSYQAKLLPGDGEHHLISPIVIEASSSDVTYNMGNSNGENTTSTEDGEATTNAWGTKDEYKEAIRDTIKRVFKKDGNTAVAIATAESGLDPNAENISDIECSIGLFQINLAKDNCHGKKVHWDKVPGDTLDEKITWLKDPYNNAMMAKFLQGSSGWWPWSVFKHDKYQQFLEKEVSE